MKAKQLLLAAIHPRLPIEGELPSLGGATEWLNSQPLTADGLRGKVVLVDFWTYTCINWLRQLPYVRAWAEKDGRPPGAAHGIDVDEQGNGTVAEQRLYQLIRQPKPIADRQFEIEFLASGVEAFAFTFG